MFDNLSKTRLLAASGLAAAALLFTACKEETAPVPAPESVDLSQTEDLFAAPVQPNPLTTDPAAVVVRVNGEEITRGEILQILERAMEQVGGRVPPQQLQQVQAQMYGQIKNDLITKKLIDAAVTAANVKVDEAEVDEAIEQIRSRMPEGQTLEEALLSESTTLDELKKNIRDDLATRQFMESKTENIAEATEEEAKEFYDANPDRFAQPESVSASHILIKFAEEDTDESKAGKKAKLEEIRANILAGTVTFEDAAKENSDCPSSAQGGSLGSFGKGRMVPEFEAAAFSQEVGEVGGIVESPFGYHIIKVTEANEAGTVAFDEAKEQIERFLTNQKRQQAVGDFIKSLRDSATIEELAP